MILKNLKFVIAFICSINVFSQEYNLPSGPVGGGIGYSKVINDTSGFYSVSNYGELIEALKSKQKIYVNGTIEVPENAIINIPNGVVLAGNRGTKDTEISKIIKSIGNLSSDPFIITKGIVRITGLIIEGPYKDVKAVDILSRGISSRGEGLEVDNCELLGWPNSAIELKTGKTTKIHHNFIHHNSRTGYGYGVEVDGDSTPLIAYNKFDYNRHSIAGSGKSGQKYTAAYNLILPNGEDHSFDMHSNKYNNDPNNDCFYLDPTCNFAGNSVLIHNNTFLYKGDRPEVNPSPESTYPTIKIRAIPQNQATIYNNYFSDSSRKHAVKIQMTAINNQVIEQEYAKGDFNNDGLIDYFRADRGIWWVNYGGTQNWVKYSTSGYKLDNLIIKDFNNDGFDDIMHHVSDDKWTVSYGSLNGTSSWEDINSSNSHENKYPLEKDVSLTYSTPTTKGWNHCYGDIDNSKYNMNVNNNKFNSTITMMYVSWSGRSNWNIISSSLFYGADQPILLGDFNGDGKTDLFRGDGENWLVSWNGMSEWKIYTSSGYKSNGLVIRDYNNDNYSDVLRQVDGSWWQVSEGSANGTSEWKNIYNGPYTNEEHIKDFDGDGIEDRFTANGINWTTVLSTSNSEVVLGASGYLINDLKFGDFDGDGITDILHMGNPPKYNLSYYESQEAAKNAEVINSTKQKKLALTVKGEYKIYPNPSSEIIIIDLPVHKKYKFNLFDNQGKLLLQFSEHCAKKEIDISNFSKGLYLLHIIDDELTVSKKVLISNKK